MPTSQLASVRSVWRRNRLAFVLGCASFLGLVFTMSLAWANHLAVPILPAVAGVRGMVAVHGLVRTIVVGPYLLFTVLSDRTPSESDQRSGHRSARRRADRSFDPLTWGIRRPSKR